MSAQSNLAGLFPPENNFEKLSANIDWQPIPVHTIPLADDYLLATQAHCDRFDLELEKFTNGSYYKGLFKKYKQLMEYLAKNSGFKMTSILELTSLYDTLYVEQLKNKRYYLS